MNKKITVGVLVALLCITASITMCITMIFSRRIFNQKVHNISEMEVMYDKVSEIDKVIRKHYIGDIDEEVLKDNIAKGFIAGIGDEKNGYYLTAKKYREIKDIEEGKKVSIGVAVDKDVTGYMKVVEVYDPSLNDKINKGDLIIKINDINVSLDTYEQCESALIDSPGTQVSIVARRDSQDIPIEIIRGYTEVQMLTYKQYEDMGYIKITGFNDATVGQFNKAIRALLKNNVKGIVFDLRNNPGGTIKSVCAILAPFLPKEQFVTMTTKDGSIKKMNYIGTNKIKPPIVVIINKKSASAAELCAQGLRHYSRSKIVGETSQGKGTMQHIFELRDGSALNLTIARFQICNSSDFHGIGIKPDYEVKLSPEQEANFEILDENTDPQLKKALEVLKSES